MLLLPELILYTKYENDWEKYEDALFSSFFNDFIAHRPKFKQKVNIVRFPEFKGRPFTFWHITSEGKKEEERSPNFRRCERISWPKFIIENYKNKQIKYWENKRKSKENICLCFGEWEYIVILRKKKNGEVTLITAYPSDFSHQKTVWEKEYNNFIKNTAN
jgi:hypothetical protein